MSARGVTATDTQRPATLTQLCLLLARGQVEVCVTTARTTPRARTASAVGYTISGIDDLVLPFMRRVFPASVIQMGPSQELPVTH